MLSAATGTADSLWHLEPCLHHDDAIRLRARACPCRRCHREHALLRAREEEEGQWELVEALLQQAMLLVKAVGVWRLVLG